MDWVSLSTSTVRKTSYTSFLRYGPILHVHVGGQVIRTTGAHPFYEESKGWVAAEVLEHGDRLLGHDGRWVEVEEVYDTGEYERVYNLRVSEYHTYFVGCESWGFSVWAHNRCTPAELQTLMHEQFGFGRNSITNAWNRFNLGGGVGNRDIKGFYNFLTKSNGHRPKLTPQQAAEAIRLVTRPRSSPRLGATPLEMWWDGHGVPVGGPNPNGLRMRAVAEPTAGEGGVYLKPQGGRTKTGSTNAFRTRYGAAEDGIEVEIPQTRFAKPDGVDDSAYRWTARRQRRFDEEYVDRMQSPSSRYRDPDNPKSPVSQEKWNQYRRIFGYGDLPENFGL